MYVVLSGYCDSPKIDTITFEVQRDRFLDGEVLLYQCTNNAEHFNATCIDGKWDRRVECDGKRVKVAQNLK